MSLRNTFFLSCIFVFSILLNFDSVLFLGASVDNCASVVVDVCPCVCICDYGYLCMFLSGNDASLSVYIYIIYIIYI